MNARRTLAVVALLAVWLAVQIRPAVGAQLTWNRTGGTGTWNTATLNWWNGSSYQAWVNLTSPYDAIFAGTKGTVTVGASVKVHNISFSVDGYTLSGTTSAITLAGTSPTITVTAAGYNATISAALSSAVDVTLTKAGPGTLVLLGANSTYTGTTRLSDGTLSFANGSLGSGGDIVFSGNSTLQWAAGNTEDISDRIQFPAAGITATFDTGGNDVTLAGWLIGDGSIAKGGSGTLSLTGVNYYTGSTTLRAGILNFVEGGLGSGNIIFGGNATLQWAYGNTEDVSGRIQSIGTGIKATLDTGNNYYVSLASGLSGAGGVTKNGFGILDLTTANTHSGPTTVVSGTLRLSHANALPGGTGGTGGSSSNLAFDGDVMNYTGGVVELTALSGDFTRALGTLPTQVQFTGSGGFSASGADCVVNLGGAWAQLTWGSGNFVPDFQPLLLGSYFSDATVDFQNPIDLGYYVRDVEVYGSGWARVDAQLSGTLTGFGGVNKSGFGTLELSTANFYTGQTSVSGGILRLSDPGALPGGTGATGGTSNLELFGGVVDLAAGNFTRALGTGPTQVQWSTNGSGGFSASGDNRIVNLGGATTPATVTWGSGGFVPTGSSLILGSYCGDATVDFQNPINLGGAARTVRADDGLAAVDGRLSGVLSGTGGLIKEGYGTLELSAANTYTGGTTVSAGTLMITNLQGLPVGRSVSIAAGGTLVLSSGLSHASQTGSLSMATTGQAAPVPEPGTLALLGAAGLAGLMARARRRLRRDEFLCGGRQQRG